MFNKSMFILLLSIVAGVIAQLVLKKGTFELSNFSISNLIPFIKSMLTNYYLIVWVLFGGISAFLWLLAISKINLSIAFPIAQAGSIILIVILSYLFFKEAITLYQCLGMLLIVVGIFLVGK